MKEYEMNKINVVNNPTTSLVTPLLRADLLHLTLHFTDTGTAIGNNRMYFCSFTYLQSVK